VQCVFHNGPTLKLTISMRLIVLQASNLTCPSHPMEKVNLIVLAAGRHLLAGRSARVRARRDCRATNHGAVKLIRANNRKASKWLRNSSLHRYALWGTVSRVKTSFPNWPT